VALQNKLSKKSNHSDIGKTFKVLIEGDSKKSINDWMGRSSENKVVVFSKDGVADKGDYVNVVVNDSTGGTLLGRITR
jgi:tRNA-2-methylthio-N6-dimethylallyladenosine synthase